MCNLYHDIYNQKANMRYSSHALINSCPNYIKPKSNHAQNKPCGNQNHAQIVVLSVQKVLSGSGRVGGLRLVGKYIDHRLVARPEPDNTFWTDSTTHYFSCHIQGDLGVCGNVTMHPSSFGL